MLSRRQWLLPAVAAGAGLAGAGWAWWKWLPGEPDAELATGLWNLSFERPSGGALAMSEFRGRPLLMNFWATWCPPCIEELPLLDNFFQQNSANGWQVLGIAVDRKTAVQDFLARSPLSFPIALAGMGGVDLSKSLGNAAGGLPYSVVVGVSGSIRARKIGKLSGEDLQVWSRLR